MNCGRHNIFLSEFAIRYEYVSFPGGTQCCPKLPHLGVIWDSIIYTLLYQQQHELRESFTQSIILFVAVGCGVIPIVPRLQVSSSLDISIARAASSPMSILASKHRPTFPTSLSRDISAVTVPAKGLWEHFHTPLSSVRALCFPLCRA